MKDHIEIVIVKHLDFVDQIPLHVLCNQGRDRIRQRRQVGGNNTIASALRQPLHQRLSNFSACARHKDLCFSHSFLLCARMDDENIRR